MSDELALLLERLPNKYRELLEQHPDASELTLQVGRPATISWGSWDKTYIPFPDRVVDEREIRYILSKFTAIRDDGRAGIDGTAHRISAIYNKSRAVIGLTIRIARRIPSALPDELRERLLESRGSVLIVGAPGSGKTTLLRAIAAALDERLGPHLNIIDTSNEIGGLGDVPTEELKHARWHQVPSPDEQPKIIQRAIANHSPLVLILDEIGYYGDVPEVEAAARRGIRVIATVHGFTIHDVVENPHYRALVGNPDLTTRRRLSRPAFSSLLEVRAKGKYYYLPDLASAVDALLKGEQPEGERLGTWNDEEPDYPPFARLSIPTGGSDELAV